MLEASRRLLASEGFEALNTNDVARVAGVSVGSLYQYFPSKESLVTAALVRQRETLRERLTDALEDSANDPSDAWSLALSRVFVEEYTPSVWLRRTLPHVPSMDASRKLDPVDDESVAVLRAFFEHRGHTRDPQGDAEVVFGLLDGTLRALVRRAPSTVDEELIDGLGRSVAVAIRAV